MIENKNDFKIQYTKGDTYALKITFKNISEDLTTAFFTVKENADDTTPIIEKTINSGISKIDNNLYKNQLVYKLQLQAEDSNDLQPNFQYLYDLKVAVGNVIKTVISGIFVVTQNVTSVDRITTTLANIEVDDIIESNAETTPATSGIEYEQDPYARLLIGNLSDLTTIAKDTVVNAINETKANTVTNSNKIGNLNDLHTTDKTNLVVAVNEVCDRLKLLFNGEIDLYNSPQQAVEVLSSTENLANKRFLFEFLDYENGLAQEKILCTYIPVYNTFIDEYSEIFVRNTMSFDNSGYLGITLKNIKVSIEQVNENYVLSLQSQITDQTESANGVTTTVSSYKCKVTRIYEILGA